MNATDMPAKPHHGKNIKRIREILGMKQEALAIELGNDWTQRRISLLEQKEEVDEDILEEVAKALRVAPDAIKSFNEDAAYNIIGNTLTNNDNVAFFQYNPTFNPIDKIVELYERMLKEKDAMIEQLKSR